MTTNKLLGCMAMALALLTAPLAADNLQTSFTGSIGTGNPCNGSIVSATGPVDVMVQTNTSAATPHVSVHLVFKAEGTANNGDAYKMSFVANANFDAVALSYDVPYHTVFVGKGKAPNFSVSGIIRVNVNAAGQPTGAWIQSLSASCTQ